MTDTLHGWTYRYTPPSEHSSTGYGRFETLDPAPRHNDPVLFAVREDWLRHLDQTPEGRNIVRLMAAAPKLLAALRAILKDQVDGVVLREFIEQARAAVAEAEGRTP